MLLLLLPSQEVKRVPKGGSSDLSRTDRAQTWECEHFTTSTNHCMISTLDHIKLTTYALSAVRKYLVFLSILQQPQHIGVVREL